METSVAFNIVIVLFLIINAVFWCASIMALSTIDININENKKKLKDMQLEIDRISDKLSIIGDRQLINFNAINYIARNTAKNTIKKIKKEL